jgi:hypothetical protein
MEARGKAAELDEVRPIRLAQDRFHLLSHHAASEAAQVRAFDSANAAFLFAERAPGLVTAELWEGPRRLCAFRKIELSGGSMWQVAPNRPRRPPIPYIHPASSRRTSVSSIAIPASPSLRQPK